MLTVESRTYISALTSGTPAAMYKGFNTFEEAEDNYLVAKGLNHIRVVRVPGDELTYRPLSLARM